MDIKKLKIRKKRYKLQVLKKFFNVKKFKVKKKTPGELIIEELKKSIKSIKISPKFLIILGVMLMFLFLFINILFFPKTNISINTSTSVVPPKLNISVVEWNTATFGSQQDNTSTVYFLVDAVAENATNFSVEVLTYSSRVPNQIYLLLTSKRESADEYPVFKSHLKEILKEKDLPVNEITMNQLKSLPGGALVIVPTGYIPIEFLEEGNLNIISLLNRGITILYIGTEFNYALDESSETLTVPVNQTILKNLPFTFTKSKISPENIEKGFHIREANYKISMGGSVEETLYGFLGVYRGGQASMLFVPAFLDEAWTNGKVAAEDVARIISEKAWLSPQNSMLYSLNENTTRYLIHSPPYSSTSSVVVRFFASNEGAEAEKIQIFYPGKSVRGKLYSTAGGSSFSSKVTEKELSFRVEFPPLPGETTPPKKILIMKVFDAFKNKVLASCPVVLNAVPLIGIKPFRCHLYLDPGPYILEVVDDEGEIHARAIFIINELIFEPLRSDFQKNVFIFTPKTETGELVTLGEVVVSVDNGTYGTYHFSNVRTINVGIDPAYTKEQPLPEGTHTFRFKVGKYEYVVEMKNKSQSIFSNPLFLPIVGVMFVGVLISLVPLLSKIIKKETYSLDIPDFPPLARIKVPIKKSKVLNIFEEVNENYRWKFTPLLLEELKEGFKKIIYNNQPLYIGDYNLEYILQQLEGAGLVKKEMDYYGLTEWERKTGKSIKSLAMYRKVRDMCIKYIIPFSKLNESDKYDMKLDVLGQNLYIYFIDSLKSEDLEKKLENALKMMGKGVVVLLFKNNLEKNDFEDILYSPSPSMARLKLEIMANSIIVLTMEKLDKMLKDMRGS